MKDILQFMGENPFLTFFLWLALLQATVYCISEIRYMVRGYPDKDEEDE
jgi:hypothetical protein